MFHKMADKHGEMAAADAVLIAVIIKRQKRRRRNRVTWTRVWIQNRGAQGAYHQLMKELRLLDTSAYRNFVRMDASTFEELLGRVGPRITRQDTVMRNAIPPGERLAVTLRFLATGK